MRLVPSGKFEARDGRKFDSGNRANQEAIVARTRQYHATTDMVVDYDHQSVFGVKDGVGGTAKAAGWVKELQVRDDGIWGRVAWTPSAAAAIKAEEYRYLSPVIPHRKADGRVLLILNVALTNTPALDLEAAAASAVFANLSEKGTEMDKILTALGLPKGTGEDAVLSAIQALLTSSTALARAAGLTEDAQPTAVLTAVTAAVADRAKLAKAAGLKPEAVTDDIVGAVQSALKANNPDPEKYVPIAALTELRDQLKELRDETSADKAEDAVTAALTAGKLTPAMKEWGIALFKSNKAAFEKFVETQPVLTKPQLDNPRRETKTGDTLDEAQLAVCTAMGLAPDAYKKILAAEAADKEAGR
ncbi:phage protease [Mesorhizobium sp. M0437]|uniref:phage protease n=1 Tax=Mesorhizobium sp. M0437 TaxID=2956945 RepID=UPI003339CFDA